MENENNVNGYTPQNDNVQENSAPQGGSYSYGQSDGSFNGGNGFYAASPQNPQPPKKKKWPIVAGAAGVAVVAGTAVGGYLCFAKAPVFHSPQKAMTTCISQLNTQFSAEKLGTSSIQEKLDSPALLEAMQKQGSEMELQLTLDYTDIDEIAAAEGVSMGISYKNDVKNGRALASVDASMLGIGGDIGLYADDKKLAFVSEEFLPDASLAISYDKLLEAMEESMDEADKQQLQEMLGQMNQSADVTQALNDYSSYVTEQLPDSLVSFAKNWDVTGSDKRESIEIGKEEYDCYTYDVSISAKAFRGFLDDYCSYLADYNYEDNAYFALLGRSYAAQLGDDASFADTITDALRELPEEIDPESDETLEMTLHIAPKGELLGLVMEEDSDNGKLELLFGGENPGQEIYLNFTSDVSAMRLSLISQTKKKTETTSFSITVEDTDEEEEILDIQMDSSYDAKKDTFSLTMDASLNADGETMNAALEAEGRYDSIDKGNGYEASYDKLAVSINSEDFSGSIELSGNISLHVLETEISALSGTEYDLLNLTDEDITALAATIEKSKTLSTLLGSLPAGTVEEMLKQFRSGFEQGLSGSASSFGLDDGLDTEDDDWDFDADDTSDDDNYEVFEITEQSLKDLGYNLQDFEDLEITLEDLQELELSKEDLTELLDELLEYADEWTE